MPRVCEIGSMTYITTLNQNFKRIKKSLTLWLLLEKKESLGGDTSISSALKWKSLPSNTTLSEKWNPFGIANVHCSDCESQEIIILVV